MRRGDVSTIVLGFSRCVEDAVCLPQTWRAEHQGLLDSRPIRLLLCGKTRLAQILRHARLDAAYLSPGTYARYQAQAQKGGPWSSMAGSNILGRAATLGARTVCALFACLFPKGPTAARPKKSRVPLSLGRNVWQGLQVCSLGEQRRRFRRFWERIVASTL